jgi:metallo-beta-lactamase family protein
MVTLSFFGAAGEVTGSCYLLQTPHARVLIDFGLFQGDRAASAKNRKLPPIKPERLDAIVLTHAHLDHCGRLPLLTKARYRGPIYATPASIDLTGIILRDAAQIQESDAREYNERMMRQGKPPVEPLYTVDDVGAVLRILRPLGYEVPTEIVPGLSILFRDAGHILGSASLEVTIHKPRDPIEVEKTIVFSADIGAPHTPILRDPVTFSNADVVILESTYGDRDHKPIDATLDEFAGVINEAQRAGGKILIPAFAVGRTQDVIYHLGQLIRDKRIKPPLCYVDSPMAAAASDLYARHTELHDPESRALKGLAARPLSFPGLQYVRTSLQSRRLNDVRNCMVIAASGMCSGGRIVHHLKHNLWRNDTHVVFVGYQGAGTLGRAIVDGASSVRIFGQPIAVKAKVHTIGGFSAHAGQSGLLAWIESLARCSRAKRVKFFLTHGEQMQRRTLAAQIQARYGLKAILPAFGDRIAI